MDPPLTSSTNSDMLRDCFGRPQSYKFLVFFLAAMLSVALAVVSIVKLFVSDCSDQQFWVSNLILSLSIWIKPPTLKSS